MRGWAVGVLQDRINALRREMDSEARKARVAEAEQALKAAKAKLDRENEHYTLLRAEHDELQSALLFLNEKARGG